MTARNLSTLVLGFLLILCGGIFLTANLTEFRIPWIAVAKAVLPILFVAAGTFRLVRHFGWPVEKLMQQPGRAGLLGGLFWLGLGMVLLLDILGILETLPFVGFFWPIVLIAFGIGKIFDYYRFKGDLQFRAIEVFGLLFVIAFGLTCSLLSRAHFPLLEDWSWGGITVGLPAEMDLEKFSYDETQEIALQDISGLHIENVYGDIEIVEEEGESLKLNLSKVVRASSRPEADSVAADVRFVTRRDNGILVIGSNREELGDRGKNLSTHVRFGAPASLPIRVVNGFGEVRITERSADCNVQNSYGRVRLVGIQGQVNVENRYEGIEVRDISGPVEIVNRRGPVRITNVKGNVKAGTDYDEISVTDVTGDLSLSNHFGSVRIDQVDGNAAVDAAGSGVTVSGISQTLQVRNSHRDLTVRDVRGAVTLESSYSQTSLVDIGGLVDLQAVHSEVSGEKLQGGLKIQGKGSQLQLSQVQGSLELVTSLRNVTISDFTGPVSIQNEYAAINLESLENLKAPVKASNRNGSISLTVPDGGNFRLSAQTVGGVIESDFGKQPLESEGEVTSLGAQIGQGGPDVELQTTYSRIQIRKRG